MQYMKAMLLLRDRKNFTNGVIVERLVWRLPTPSIERPHGLKYRLYCGQSGHCLVRYDNEAGKGDHCHYGNLEQPYRFVSLEQLLMDFEADVRRVAGVSNDE
jgi:uncharacterized protein YwbE